MEHIKSNFKQHTFLRLCAVLFMLINTFYISFEVFRTRFIEDNILTTGLEKIQIEVLLTISLITSSSEVLLILLSLAYLIMTYYKSDKPSIRFFIFFNFSFYTGLFLISYIVSLAFLAPIGNLSQQLFIPFSLIMIGSIYFAGNIFFRKLLQST